MLDDMAFATESRKPSDFAGDFGKGEFDLGGRLREIRTAARLSQRQLAARAGVSNTTISLIEQSRTSPSLTVLQRILEALSITLVEFFHEKDSEADKLFFHHAELASVSSGSVLSRKIPQEGTNRRIHMTHSFFQPGADTGEQSLPYDSEQSGVVVRGYLEVTVDDSRRILGPGDAFHFNSRLPHRFRNAQDIECEIVVSSVPRSLS